MSHLPYPYTWNILCVECGESASSGSAGFFSAVKRDAFVAKKKEEAKTILCKRCKRKSVSQPKDATTQHPIQFLYTNYKGERSYRTVIPLGFTWSQGNEWHPDPQWMLEAHDLDKDAHRSFACRDIGQIDWMYGTRPGPATAMAELREAVGGALDHVDPLDSLEGERKSPQQIIAEAQELARKFCEGRGWEVVPGLRFDQAKTVRAREAWRATEVAYEMILGVNLADILDELEEAP